MRFFDSLKISNIPVGQISHSEVNEGVVKGWHGHVHQHQWNYVVSGKAKAVLKDSLRNLVLMAKL